MTAPSVATRPRADRAPLPASQLLWIGAAVAAGAAAAAGMAPFLALALALLIACAVGTLHSPFVFLWILTALTGIGFGFGHAEALEIGGYTIRINGLRWALIISTCVLILLRGRRAPLPYMLRPWLLLVLLAAAGVVWSPVPVEGVKQLLLYAAPLLVAMVALYAVTREQDIHALRSALFLAMVLGAIVGIVPFLAGGALGGTLDEGGRPLHRAFGTFLLPILALALARLRHRPDLSHAAIAVAVLALGVLTLSRTTVAAMLLLGLVLVVLGPLRLKLSVGALLVVFTTVALSYEPLSERMFTDSRRGFTRTVEVTGTGGDAQILAGGIDTSGRGFVWLQTALSAARTPWRGQGTGSATEFVTRITAAEAVFPHNEYLRAFHDWGVAGLIVVFAAFAVPIIAFARLRRRATRELTRELALAAALTWIAFAAVSVFDNTLLYFTFFTQNIFLVSALALRAEQV
jgi:O-antigen ligase